MIENYRSISRFKGLNSLRFMAAFLVVIHHAESLRKDHDLYNWKALGLFQNGSTAVSFFFVLSGFLITYLLIREVDTTKTVSVKRFYLKRVFRIWPLYFLMVLVGAVIQPFFIAWFHVPYEMPFTIGETWYYFLFFVPGLVNFQYGNSLLEPLWSIGVEEIYYLIWAPLVKFFRKYILYLLLGMLAFKLVLLILIEFVELKPIISYLIRIHQFESMAIGGLGAYLVFHHGAKIPDSRWFSVPVQLFFFGLLFFLLLGGGYIDRFGMNWLFKDSILAALVPNVLFLYLILAVSLVPHSLIHLENKYLDYLGEISYGIYMYHLLFLSFATDIVTGFLKESNPLVQSVFFYVFALLCILGVSALSKRTLEAYFERLKRKVLEK